jgi:DNA-binding FrmR family transcriptional regulator
MSLCGTDQNKKQLLLRLRKIEGQVRGLHKMVEQDRNCIEVLRQITSVTGALRGVWTELVGEHLRGCVTRAVQTDDHAIIDELIDHLRKIR